MKEKIRERKEQLKYLKKIIIKYESYLCDAIFKDLSKPKEEFILTELFGVYDEFNFFIKNLNKLTKLKKFKNGFYDLFSETGYVYQPVGKVLILNTWNYPINLLFIPLAGSLASGNETVLRLHPFTPEINKVIKLIVDDYNQVYSNIQLVDNRDDLIEFINNNEWNFIFYTGSTNIGYKIKKIADSKNISCCLELGGKSPSIIFSDCKINKTIDEILFGKSLNMGQTCIAPDYLLVESSIYNKFILNFEKTLNKFNKTLKTSKIINENSKERIKSYNKDITLDKIQLLEISNIDCSIMKQEIFGPVLPIVKFDNFEDIKRVIDKNKNPLSIYVFTENNKNIEFIKTISTGNIMINSTMSILNNNKLSFGGIGNSGINRYRGKASFELFSNKISFNKNIFDPYLFIKKNLYSKTNKFIIKLIHKIKSR